MKNEHRKLKEREDISNKDGVSWLGAATERRDEAK